jgi:hypothetical protein
VIDSLLVWWLDWFLEDRQREASGADQAHAGGQGK